MGRNHTVKPAGKSHLEASFTLQKLHVGQRLHALVKGKRVAATGMTGFGYDQAIWEIRRRGFKTIQRVAHGERRFAAGFFIREPRRNQMVIGLSMILRGEVGLIFAQLSFTQGSVAAVNRRYVVHPVLSLFMACSKASLLPAVEIRHSDEVHFLVWVLKYARTIGISEIRPGPVVGANAVIDVI